MKRIAITFLLIGSIITGLSVGLLAQKTAKPHLTTPTKNAVSLQWAEQSGKGISLDYQRLLWGNNKVALRGSVGIGQAILSSSNQKLTNFATIVPHSVLLDIGAGRSSAEVGIGGTYTAPFVPLGAANYSLYPMLGYRYESASRVFFHLYFAPILFQNRNTETPCLDCPIPLDRNAINPSGGIGAGIAF